MKTISLCFLGEKIELNVDDKFYEFIIEDIKELEKLNTPKEILAFFLSKKGKEFKVLENLYNKLTKE